MTKPIYATCSTLRNGWTNFTVRDSDAEEVENRLAGVAEPADELKSCLRGAITAMEALACTHSSFVRFPGLPDLIKRSKEVVDARA